MNNKEDLLYQYGKRKIVYMVYDYNTLENRGAPVLLQC